MCAIFGFFGSNWTLRIYVVFVELVEKCLLSTTTKKLQPPLLYWPTPLQTSFPWLGLLLESRFPKVLASSRYLFYLEKYKFQAIIGDLPFCEPNVSANNQMQDLAEIINNGVEDETGCFWPSV